MKYPQLMTFFLPDSISIRMRQLIDNATSPLFSNVTLDALQNLESYEV